jgi:transcriptional regulator with XRE-family HTH domain
MADGEREERLGEIIRRQRELSALSMRQFADLVGISNPYLSQIERGLRDPSEKVLEGIAKSLQISVDTLREQAGMSVAADEETPAVVDAIREDPHLTGRQRQAMLEIYAAFTASSTGRGARPRRSSGSSGSSG